jgi:hypothetical protein
MKKTLITLLVFAMLCSLIACNETEPQTEQPETVIETQTLQEARTIAATADKTLDDNISVPGHYTFEEFVSMLATDVVVARYAGHRPFGERQTLVEYEFAVLDRVLGNAADRIFVYTPIVSANQDPNALNLPNGFDANAEYLLALEKSPFIVSHLHEDGYMFILGTVINLDEPSLSVMGGEPLSLRSDTKRMDLNSRSLSKEAITSYILELTKDNPTGREFIKSTQLEDIINGSPNVLVVEINAPLNLSSGTDWSSSVNYNVSTVRTLKGDAEVGFKFTMSFFADTVKEGEQHIVAVELFDDNIHDWFDFTSRNSLFGMEQLDEIMKIIENG